MHPNQISKFSVWLRKTDSPTWNSVDFEYMNTPLDDDNQLDSNKMLFLNKPIALGYNKVKNSDYENLKLEKQGYNKHFDEDCVEKIKTEMSKIESHIENHFKNEIESSLDTIPENYKTIICWLCTKTLGFQNVFQNVTKLGPSLILRGK